MKVSVVGLRGFPQIEGGVEKHCEILYPLLDSDIDITVYRRKVYVNSNQAYDNIRFVDLPSTRIKGFETVLHSFLATCGSILSRPDIIHYHNIGPAMFAPLAKLFSIPIVLTFHSPNYEHKKWGFFAKKLLKFSETLALNSADRIIFVNRFQMEKYPERIQKKSVYLPNGINKPAFPEHTNFLEKHGLEPGKYILSVGRITPEKGFHTLIPAFQELRNQDVKLVIAGGVEFESGYKEELEALCEDGKVIFTDYVFGDDLSQLYVNAGLFVLASENEGFPLVLLEAMSYNVNVLVSDIPATHLVALEENDYFETGNVCQLTERMREKMFNITSRKYDLETFNWKKIAGKVSSIYREVT